MKEKEDFFMLNQTKTSSQDDGFEEVTNEEHDLLLFEEKDDIPYFHFTRRFSIAYFLLLEGIKSTCIYIISKLGKLAGFAGVKSSIVLIVLSAFLFASQKVNENQNQAISVATKDLSTFISIEKANSMNRSKADSNIEESFVDNLQVYARAHCVHGEDFDRVQLALNSGLDGIPDNVREKLVTMAVVMGVSQKYSIQDTATDFQEEGRAFSYKAFWSTVYSPKDGYETCLLVTGVELILPEAIIGWNVFPQKIQIASEPCHCGVLYCNECPVFHEFDAKQPIYERRSMSLRKQRKLRDWMVDKAIEAAEPLVVAADFKQWNPISILSWTDISKEYIIGDFPKYVL